MGSLLMVWAKLEAVRRQVTRQPPRLPSPTFEIALRKLQRGEERDGWRKSIANFWNHTNRLAGSPGGGGSACWRVSPPRGQKRNHSAELDCAASRCFAALCNTFFFIFAHCVLTCVNFLNKEYLFLYVLVNNVHTLHCAPAQYTLCSAQNSPHLDSLNQTRAGTTHYTGGGSMKN